MQITKRSDTNLFRAQLSIVWLNRADTTEKQIQPKYFLFNLNSTELKAKQFMKLLMKNCLLLSYFKISMAIQQGNAVCVMGCPKNISTGLEGLAYSIFKYMKQKCYDKKIFVSNIFLTRIYVSGCTEFNVTAFNLN